MTKTVDGVTYTYLYAGGKLLRETYGDTTLDFFYDANGNPFALNHNGTVYYYITNLQGDVLFIVDEEGSTVASYTYDPYGKVLTATGTMAEVNPLRYRGYYYDTETGFYYLQSRYYDPSICRFINADGYASTGQGIVGHNMFAYCGNNPINRTDSSGDIWEWLVAGLIIGIGMLTSGCSDQEGTQNNISPNPSLASAPDLIIGSTDFYLFNCYGNAIGKAIDGKPTGYKTGDSVEKIFQAVQQDLGINNVRRLESIDSPINENEYKVALRCNESDFHFIRLTNNGWYNKSGTLWEGVYLTTFDVLSDTWYSQGIYQGELIKQLPFYSGETIYFAVRVGWDAE